MPIQPGADPHARLDNQGRHGGRPLRISGAGLVPAPDTTIRHPYEDHR